MTYNGRHSARRLPMAEEKGSDPPPERADEAAADPPPLSLEEEQQVLEPSLEELLPEPGDKKQPKLPCKRPPPVGGGDG